MFAQLCGGFNRRITESGRPVSLVCVNSPAIRCMSEVFAEKSFPGRAYLVRIKLPEMKSESFISTARESAYALLVIWHKIQSSRSTPASTTAGRSLLADKSEKGNLTRTIDPTEGETMPHLPPVFPSHAPAISDSIKLFRECRVLLEWSRWRGTNVLGVMALANRFVRQLQLSLRLPLTCHHLRDRLSRYPRIINIHLSSETPEQSGTGCRDNL